MIASRYRQGAYYLFGWDINGRVYQYGDLSHWYLSSYWQLDELLRTHSRRAPVTNVEVGGYSQYTPRFPSLRYNRKSSKTSPISISDNKKLPIFHKRLRRRRSGNEFKKVSWIVNQRILITVADHQAIDRNYIRLYLPIIILQQPIAVCRQSVLKCIPSHQQTNPFWGILISSYRIVIEGMR